MRNRWKIVKNERGGQEGGSGFYVTKQAFLGLTVGWLSGFIPTQDITNKLAAI